MEKLLSLQAERRRREAQRETFTTPEVVTNRRPILGPPAEGWPGPSTIKSSITCARLIEFSHLHQACPENLKKSGFKMYLFSWNAPHSLLLAIIGQAASASPCGAQGGPSLTPLSSHSDPLSPSGPPTRWESTVLTVPLLVLMSCNTIQWPSNGAQSPPAGVQVATRMLRLLTMLNIATAANYAQYCYGC